jgi:dipeptidyl aminopeptidase/acylaminoacyl peptidase
MLFQERTMEQKISFESAGITLRGTLHVPDGAGSRPAMIQCHGFGGSSSGAGHPELARTLERAGYVVLRFDFRGCGESDGKRGSVICMEEVEDLRNAIGFLEQQPRVDRKRIGLIGASLGGAVVLYVAATDQRVRVCAANGAVGNGERRFRFQYPDEAGWKPFLQRLEDAKRERGRTGKSVMFPRYDIVLIPEHNRAGMPPGAIMEFTAETAMSMLAFNPEPLVKNISPRPLLLIHPRHDEVVPKSESEHLAAAAGQPCELHIIDTKNHFGSGDPELQRITLDWLSRYMPAQ